VSVALGSAPATQLRLDKAMARLDLSVPAGRSATLTITNAGSTPVYARILARGTPALGQEKAMAKGLSLGLRYLGMDGKTVDPAAAQSGADFVVEATVQNRSGQNLKNLALTQLLPSGWEIANFRVGAELPKPAKEEEEGARPEAPPPLYDYQDVRDDRVLTYFSIAAKEAKVFKLYVNKSYEGSFYLPPSSVSAMYDERFQALVPGRWLQGGRSGAAEHAN